MNARGTYIHPVKFSQHPALSYLFSGRKKGIAQLKKSLYIIWESVRDLLRYFLSTYPNVLYALCPEPRDAFRELLERRNMVEEYITTARKWAKREVPEVGIQEEVNETVRETQRAKEEADRLLDDLVDLFERKKKGRRKR